jgi:hypothetical protein
MKEIKNVERDNVVVKRRKEEVMEKMVMVRVPLNVKRIKR